MASIGIADATIRRIGLLATSADAVAEMDYKNLLPQSVPFFTGRLYHDVDTPRGNATLDAIVSQIEPAIRMVAQVAPELIVFACTSGSFYKGYGWDEEIARRIRSAADVPAIVTTTAVCDALKTLEAKRIFLVTPYIDSINRAEIGFLGGHSIEVNGLFAFECARGVDICAIRPREIFDAVSARARQVRNCDALLISCTALRGLEVVDALEEYLGIPVISSNQATVWAALRALNIAPETRVGRLFSQKK